MRQREAEHAWADGAGHQRHAASGLRQQNGVVNAPVAAIERDPLAREQAPDDLEGLGEAGDTPLDRQAEDRVLDLHRARAEPEHEPPARDLVDRGRHLRDQAGRMEARARDERTEPNTLRDGGQCRQQRPGLPGAALLAAVTAVQEVVAEPDRVEPGLLCRLRHRQVLGPAHVALDLGQLDSDSQRDLTRRSE